MGFLMKWDESIESRYKPGSKMTLAFTYNGKKYAVKVTVDSCEEVESYDETGIVFKMED